MEKWRTTAEDLHKAWTENTREERRNALIEDL